MSCRTLVAAAALLVVAVSSGARTPRVVADAGKQTGPLPVLVTDGSPVHDAGNLLLHMSNWGMFGSWPGAGLPFSSAPSAEWPAGSGVEYLYVGGLWVGAVKDGVFAVSTAAYEFEFRPTPDPVDVVYRSSEGAVGGNRLPSRFADDDGDGRIDEDPLDGRDNDGDGRIDEDYAAISTQMFSRWYTDDQQAAIDTYPRHNPLHIMVRERSYLWDHPDFDDFVGVDYEITNTGDTVLEDVYVGFFLDTDAGSRSTPNYWEDDDRGFVDDYTRDSGYGPVTFDYAYGFDADGDGGATMGDFGIVVLDHPTDPSGETAPARVGVSTYMSFEDCGGFDCDWVPISDWERYYVMAMNTIDRDVFAPRDTRFLVSVGPFAELRPGQTIPFSMALVATPKDGEFDNVANAVVAYQGRFFDVDGDPNTGTDGKEYQAHWWLPGQEPPVEPMAAGLKITPQTINLNSMGDPLLAHVTLPKGYRAADVDGASVKLNGHPGEVQSDGNGGTFVARFSRKMLGGAVGKREMTFTCTANGQPMRATDIVRVIAGGPQLAGGATPAAVELSLSPNPFNPSARIAFELPRAADVTLEVYSASGALVRRLASGSYPVGRHDVTWQGRDDAGHEVASGIYFCRLTADGATVTKKLVLVK